MSNFDGRGQRPDEAPRRRREPRPLLMTFTGVAIVILGLTVQAGCEQKVPRPALPTYPVRGRVVTAGKLPSGGCVQFEPTQNGPDYVAQGVVDQEGRFSLQVPYVDRVLPGATKGPHHARVLLPLRDGGTTVTIEGTFVVEPQQNEFTIQMPKAPAS